MVALGPQRLPTVDAIYRVYVDAREDDERTYLGASVIGEPCERKLWYGFRWVYDPEQFDGRKLRLFETGHREEARMIDDLRRAGVEVWDRDPDDPQKQIGVVAIGGHFRGHLDGIGVGFVEAPKAAHVLELKTHNTKSFAALLAHGVAESKPLHHAQMQVYMHLMSLTRAFYLAHHKDTDELYAERIRYDSSYAMWLMAKAQHVITAARPLAKLHDDPEHKMAWPCRCCPALAGCHQGGWARRNCRTCIHSTPELDGDGRWHCERHRRDLTKSDQRAGCAHHLYIPELVPGQVIETDQAKATITYQLEYGEVFIDGPAEQEPAQ